MNNDVVNSSLNLNKNSSTKNEITSDLTYEINKLHTLRRLEATLDANGITNDVQNDIDILMLNPFENSELNKLRESILNKYTKLEKEERTFFAITYATMVDKKKAEKEYIEMKNLKSLAKNTLDVNERKKILEKINSYGFTNKNISYLLYEIDQICKTFDDTTYKDFEELEIAINEKKQLNDFIAISEILDNTNEISALLNIRKKFEKIKSHNYLNKDIQKYIVEIENKLKKLEDDAKFFNGRHYDSLERVQEIKEELHIIETEAYKFDTHTKAGLELFLELMSLQNFSSIEAKEKLDEYKDQYSKLKKQYLQEEKINFKLILKEKKLKRFKIALYSTIASLVLFVFGIGLSVASQFLLGVMAITTAVLISFICIIYMIYSKLSMFISDSVDSVKSKFTKKQL